MIFQQLEINCIKPKSPIISFRLRRTTEKLGGTIPKSYEFQIYYNALKLRTLSRRQYAKLLTYIDERHNPFHRTKQAYQEFHVSDLLPDRELIFDLVSSFSFQLGTTQKDFYWYWNVYGYYFIHDQLTHFMDKTIIITGHIPCPHELHYKLPLDRELQTSNAEK